MLAQARVSFLFQDMKGFFLEMMLAAALTVAYVAFAMALHRFHLLVPAG